MSKPVVYLAGLISTDVSKSLQWRVDVKPRLEDLGFEVLSPMRGKDPAKLVRGGVVDPSLTARDIVLRDFNDIRRSTVILAHLEVFGGSRPLLGTIAELAWAWQLNIPVVGIADFDNVHNMQNHPFTREFISHYFTTHWEAADFIAHYYGGK